MATLVTGGAGYIGSHMVQALVKRRVPVVVIDNFLSGHREAVPESVPLLEADVSDGARVVPFLQKHGVDGDIGKAPGIKQFLKSLPHVTLPERTADMQRQQTVQFGAGERLI